MPQHAYSQSPVAALVRAASRRRHGLLVLQQCSYAVTAALGGAILMLLLGTQILQWYWLVLLVFFGLIVGAVRLRGQFLTKYQVAQMLDQRLRLSDTLSTAWFLLTTSTQSSTPSQLQMKQAERLAASIKPNAAFPFQGERAWTVAVLLLVIACGLFAMRYLVQNQLAFQQPLIPLHLGGAAEQRLASERPPATDRHSEEQHPQKEQDQYAGDRKTPLDRDGTVEDREARGPANQNSNQQPSQSQDRQSAGQGNSNQRDQRTSEEDRRASKAKSSDSSDTSRTGDQQTSGDKQSSNTFKPSNEQQRKNATQEPSLTSKLRDALSGLLQKMHGGSQSARAGQEGPQSSEAKSTRNQMTPNRDPQASAEENGTGKTADANTDQSQSQQAQASSASASASQRDGADKSSGQRSPDSHSAAGRQDGSKETKEAEQLRAMGKLAEILGKRSNDVSGEITVETSSGKQQLQTSLTEKTGKHTGLGGEINHNQVPLDDQQYVRDYMKQVHQQPNEK